MKKGSAWRIAAIVAAATVGDGVFALPYVFYYAGWLISLIYLVVLGALIITAHVIYLQTLEKVGEKERLLGLSRKYLGEEGFWLGFLAIVIGLLLTLVAYIILGSQFVHVLVPVLPGYVPLLIFWAFISLPIFLPDKYIVDLELFGILCTSAVIFLIFITAWPNVTFANIPAVNWHNLFLPFGAVLFSLAGWTSIEPAYEARKKRVAGGRTVAKNPWKALAAGTLFAGFLYAMFAAGILGSTHYLAADTVSGLADWPAWKRELLALLGLCAVATVYIPISREIKNSLEKDLKWKKVASRSVIVLLPVLLIAAGFNNFLTVVGIVGGVFLSMQYLLIITVGRHALKLTPAKKFLLDLAAAVFIIAAVYQIYTFIVR